MSRKVFRVVRLARDRFDVDAGRFDFHVALDGGAWIADAFRSGVKLAARAHIDSQQFESLGAALEWCLRFRGQP